MLIGMLQRAENCTKYSVHCTVFEVGLKGWSHGLGRHATAFIGKIRGFFIFPCQFFFVGFSYRILKNGCLGQYSNCRGFKILQDSTCSLSQ